MSALLIGSSTIRLGSLHKDALIKGDKYTIDTPPPGYGKQDLFILSGIRTGRYNDQQQFVWLRANSPKPDYIQATARFIEPSGLVPISYPAAMPKSQTVGLKDEYTPPPSPPLNQSTNYFLTLLANLFAKRSANPNSV